MPTFCLCTKAYRPSISKLFGKTDFKRMRYPVHVILMALSMFYLGKNSFRNIALILRTVMNLQVFHTTISNWCTRFAPMFQNIAIQLIPALNFNSDEWHADETVVKIQGNATSGSFWTVRRALSLAPQGQSAGLYHTGCRKAYGGLLKPLSATVTSLKCLSRRCMG